MNVYARISRQLLPIESFVQELERLESLVNRLEEKVDRLFP